MLLSAGCNVNAVDDVSHFTCAIIIIIIIIAIINCVLLLLFIY